jgi:hypothetical protein
LPVSDRVDLGDMAEFGERHEAGERRDDGCVDGGDRSADDAGVTCREEEGEEEEEKEGDFDDAGDPLLGLHPSCRLARASSLRSSFLFVTGELNIPSGVALLAPFAPMPPA